MRELELWSRPESTELESRYGSGQEEAESLRKHCMGQGLESIGQLERGTRELRSERWRKHTSCSQGHIFLHRSSIY